MCNGEERPYGVTSNPRRAFVFGGSGGATLAKERDLLRRFLLRLRRRRGRREVRRERAEVGDEGLPQRRLVKGRGRVVDGEDRQAVGGTARFAVDARYRLTGKEFPHRVPPERDDHAWAQHREVTVQPQVAGSDLVRQRVSSLGWSVTVHDGDEHFPQV